MWSGELFILCNNSCRVYHLKLIIKARKRHKSLVFMLSLTENHGFRFFKYLKNTSTSTPLPASASSSLLPLLLPTVATYPLLPQHASPFFYPPAGRRSCLITNKENPFGAAVCCLCPSSPPSLHLLQDRPYLVSLIIFCWTADPLL